MRPETRERVLKAIRKLNYTPFKAARTLRHQRTKIIGLLIPDVSNLYFARLTRGVESVAFDRGFSTLICDSNHQLKRESRYLDILLAEGVEGVVFVPVGEPDMDTISRLIDQGIRIVVPDRRVKGLPSIEADNLQASFELTQHLLALGYRKLGYVSGPADVSTAQDRLEGFRRALESTGMQPVAVEQGNFTYESGYVCAQRIIDERDVDAILAANDLMAFGVLRAADEGGMSVPGQLGVAGFDHVPSVPYASFGHPGLTTVHVPVHRMGQVAARMVLDGSDVSEMISTTLIPGGTCCGSEKE